MGDDIAEHAREGCKGRVHEHPVAVCGPGVDIVDAVAADPAVYAQALSSGFQGVEVAGVAGWYGVKCDSTDVSSQRLF